MRYEVGHYVKVVYDFTAQQSSELSLRVGDIIRITDVVDSDWLQGEAICGGSGIFPANFVEKLVLPDTRMGQRVFVALVDFPAEQSGDLELSKGDIILGVEQVDEHWWKGKNGPLRGIFPLSCVQELVVSTEGPRSRSASLRSRSSSIMSRSNSLATHATPELVFARALVDVVPQIEGELGFQTGDLITVKEIVDDDWFYGECHNKVGLVSTICVEFMDDVADTSATDFANSSAELNSSGNYVSPPPRPSYQDSQAYSSSAYSQSDHTKKNLPLHSTASYTSENTRSHDAEITPYAKTLYPFQAQLPSELSFGDNEIVTLIQHVDEDWIEGELDGKIGLFPANFVEIIVDCPYAYNNAVPQPQNVQSFTGADDKEFREEGEETSSVVSGDVKTCADTLRDVSQRDSRAGGEPCDMPEKVTQNGHTSPSVSQDSGLSEPSLALVLHNFLGEVQGDLTVKEGDTIEVLKVIDDDWLEARRDDGSVGMVPKNHVQVITGGPLSKSERTESLSEKSEEISKATAKSYNEINDTYVDEGNLTSTRLEEDKASVSERPKSREITPPKDKALDTVQSSDISASKQKQGSSATSAFSSLSSTASEQQCENRQMSVPKPATEDGKPKPPEKPKLLPKPKLAQKPAVKPKPLLTPKPFVPKYTPSFGHVVSPTETKCFTLKEEEEHVSDSGREKKTFTDLDTKQSLDNIVQAELRKAKTEGERSRGSSFNEDEKRSSTGSFSSTTSDDQNKTSKGFDPHEPPQLAVEAYEDQNLSQSVATTHSLSEVHSAPHILNNLEKVQEISGENVTGDTGSEHGAVHNSGKSTDAEPWETRTETVPSINGGQSLLPPPPPPSLNRSASDSRFGEVTMQMNTTSLGAVNKRHSLPPARPVPPPPIAAAGRSDIKRLSYVNKAYEHDGEGQLVNVDTSEGPKAPPHPPPPSRPVPPPPPPVISAASKQNKESVQQRVKRPPPRPTGPRIASVPSKTPLQPTKVDSGNKLIPNRPAPPAPVPHRPAPVAPGPHGPSPSSAIPPRPMSLATTPPPKRPPPRTAPAPAAKSPSDLMRFSPEPVSDDEGNAEIVADLKRRLQENQADIQKYEQTRQELETKLSQQDEAEKGEVQDNLQFVTQTIQGLREEEKRLKGNLFSVSPREERMEKAKLLAEQRALDEQQRQLEERKQQAEMREKRRQKREKVLHELIDTEKDYLFDLQLCLATFFEDASPVKVPKGVDIEFLFGNMEEIADVSQRLLTSLESAIAGKDFYDQVVGTVFVALAEDMKNTYAPYCRHHDDVIAEMEKHKEVPEICQYFSAKVEEMKRQTNIFNMEALLIKPVQRVLKYPLLLNELLKSTEDNHPDKTAIANAIRAMTDVATAINEYKRRKDLVYKYKKDSDQTFSMKIAKLNLHSIKKKSSRMRGRLSTGLGIGLQLRDENFEQEEMKFRSAEKAVKVLMRSVLLYMDHLQEVVTCQENLAGDIADYYGDQAGEEVSRYLAVHEKVLGHYKTLRETVEELVLVPLNKLVAMLNGPNNVIEKRFDKLLDYNNLLGRGKDEKLVQAAKNDYEAMNAQLLDELPKLYQLIMDLMRQCMAAYVRAQRDFTDRALKENCVLLELRSMLGASENIMESFNIRHTAALDQISMLSFIPRGFNPKVDSFRLDRKAGHRQSFDMNKPAPTIQSPSQSDSQRMYLRQTYGPDSLYRVTQTTSAHDIMDMAVTKGTLLGVIKDKDPMGGRTRWLVDDGVNKGFVPSSVLVKANLSPAGSLSDLTAEDTSDTASVHSGMDDMELISLQGNYQGSSQLYPDMTEISTPKAPSPFPTPEPIEYYRAEYPFTARSNNELTLSAGQVVVVLQKQDMDGNPEWWLVEADGLQGYAPANYLRKV